MQQKQTSGGNPAGLRWGIQLTSVATAGAFLGAATSTQIGLTMAAGAIIGGLSLGTVAIVRRWLSRRGAARGQQR